MKPAKIHALHRRRPEHNSAGSRTECGRHTPRFNEDGTLVVTDRYSAVTCGKCLESLRRTAKRDKVTRV